MMKTYTETKQFKNLAFNFPIVISYTLSGGGTIDIQYKQGNAWVSSSGELTQSGAKAIDCFGFEIQIVVSGAASYSLPFLEALT